MARALQVSTDQLADLLTESEGANAARALSADAEGAIPAPLPKFQSEVWLGRAEFEDLIRPLVAETTETRSDGVSTENLAVSRSSQVPLVAQPVTAELGRPVAVNADHEAVIALGPALSGLPADIALPADVDTAGTDIAPDTPVTTTAGASGFARSAVPEPQTDVPDLSSVTTIPLNLPLADVQWRRARPRRFKRFVAAGVLALVGGAASVPFITSDNGPIPPAAAGNPTPAAPVAAIPASDPGGSNSSRSNDFTGAPAAAPGKPADGLAASGAAAVPTPKTTRNGNRTTSRSRPPAAMTAPSPPRTPAIPPEAYAWSEMAAASASEHRRARLRPEGPPYP